MKDRIKFILAGAEVTRYHTVRTLQTETVGHHSHGVAMFCIMLTDHTPSSQLLTAALIHDLAEHQLGDIPSPAKKQYGIGEQVNALEAKLLIDAGLTNALCKADARIMKLADILQGMSFCIRELQMGNSCMRTVLDRYKSYAESMILTGIERRIFDTLVELENDCKR